MAITVGSLSYATKKESKSIKVSHRCSTKAKILVAHLHSGTSLTNVSVMFGSANMRKLVEKKVSSKYVAVFYIISPLVNVRNDIIASYNESADAVISAFDIYGAKLQEPTSTSNSGSTNACSTTISSSTGSFVFGAVSKGGNSTASSGSGQTIVYKNLVSGALRSFLEYKSGSASTTLSWTFDSDPSWVVALYSIEAETTPEAVTSENAEFISSEIWMKPIYVVEKDRFNITDIIYGGSTITKISAKIYLGATDKTYECMLGSADSFSGNKYTTNMISNLKGNNIYILSVLVHIDGFVKTRKCQIFVEKESATR